MCLTGVEEEKKDEDVGGKARASATQHPPRVTGIPLQLSTVPLNQAPLEGAYACIHMQILNFGIYILIVILMEMAIGVVTPFF